MALNVGCGRVRWEGWVAVDVDRRADVVTDIRQLPYDDASVDRVAAIHVLEHVYPWEALDVICEWKRVLVQGGRIILELPSMNKVFARLALVLQSHGPLYNSWVWHPLWGDPSYKDPAMMHQWGYLEQEVKQLLVQAGFRAITSEPARYHVPERDMRLTAVKEG